MGTVLGESQSVWGGLLNTTSYCSYTHPEVATSLNNLALSYGLHTPYKEAEKLFRRALSIFENALGETHPRVGVTLNNLAELYKAHGRYEQSDKLFKRALAIFEKVFDQTHPYIQRIHKNLSEQPSENT